VFSLNNANLTGPEMAARFDAHLSRIVQRASTSIHRPVDGVVGVASTKKAS